MNYALVGAFVLFLGAALIAVLLWLASGGDLQKKVDLYLAIEEESVAGLNLNAPVKYNGVDVGKVRVIQLDPTNPERVQLVFAIEHGTPIKVDTVATLKIQGLTGIAYVELDGGSRASPTLTASEPGQYPVIRTKPSLSARLENVLTSVLAKLDRTSSNIDAILSNENRVALTSALADIAAVAHTIAARKGTIDAGIVSAARTFDNTARATVHLDATLERVGRGGAAVARMGDAAASASIRAEQTITEVGTDLQRFSGEALPEVQRLLGELNDLSTSLRRLSEQTERNPSGLLFGQRPVPDGPGESSPGPQPP